MTGDHPNAALVRRQFDNQGPDTDPQAWLDGLSDDVEWHEIGQSEAIHGKQALVEARYGKGRVVLFGFRPQFRGQAYGAFKFLLNAIYLASAQPLRD